MRLLICAGGTGGGVYPALSVLQALTGDEAVDRAGSQPAPGQKASLSVLWIGGERGMEADLVKREGVPFDTIPAAGVHGVGWRALPGNLGQLAQGFQAARRILRQFQPDVLFFTGGYLAVPMALAARLPLKGSPRPRQLVYVPDIEPGLALKVLIWFADVVAVSVAETLKFLPKRSRSRITGYPVRRSLQTIERSEACRTFGLKPELPVFLVWGGSKGARSINRALMNVLPQVLAMTQVIHLSGQLDWPEVELNQQKLSPELNERYRLFPYLHEQMGAALSAADLALTRAGASSLGELPMFGLPAVLVPYPYTWRYQVVNAQYLVDTGAAVMLKDADLAAELLPVVNELLLDSARRGEMRQKMQKLAQPGAARAIADTLLALESGAR